MSYPRAVGKRARGAAVDAVADRVRAPKGVRKNARLTTGYGAATVALDSGSHARDKGGL
jgi:hypothetical protein